MFIVNSFAEWALLLSLEQPTGGNFLKIWLYISKKFDFFCLILFQTVLKTMTITDSEEVGRVIDDWSRE